jgi:hypothetical protein
MIDHYPHGGDRDMQQILDNIHQNLSRLTYRLYHYEGALSVEQARAFEQIEDSLGEAADKAGDIRGHIFSALRNLEAGNIVEAQGELRDVIYGANPNKPAGYGEDKHER